MMCPEGACYPHPDRAKLADKFQRVDIRKQEEKHRIRAQEELEERLNQ